MINGCWDVTVEEDEDGNLILPLPEEMLKEADWREGDTLDWQDNGNKTFTIINISWQQRQPMDKVA